MATEKEYKDFVLEQLSSIGDIACRSMMGEYLLYRNGTLFGGIYDDRFLIKKTVGNAKYEMEEQVPYDGAKAMYMVCDLDNKELLKEIVEKTCEGLKKERQKR